MFFNEHGVDALGDGEADGLEEGGSLVAEGDALFVFDVVFDDEGERAAGGEEVEELGVDGGDGGPLGIPGFGAD